MTHSPDHAERAREVLAAAFRIVDGIAGEINGVPNEPTGDAADVVAGDLADTLGVEFDQDWPEAAAAALAAALRGRDRVVEALTPSADTKAAYIGEFGFNIVDRDEDGDEVYRNVRVPWDTVKEIMAAILARAALHDAAHLQQNGEGEGNG